jgi:glucoamylase
MRQRLLDYMRFSRGNQTTATLTGLGEPKFHVDGTAFMENWCRPQNDGPALRAITLTHFARRLLASGDRAIVTSELYDSKIPTNAVIKADLEYVAHHWRETTCDIWEEVTGDHLYTRLAQHRALVEGAALARDLGDPAAANFYVSQALALETEIDRHWDPMRGILIPTLNRTATRLLSTKGDIDTQVILGLLHGSGIAITDARARSTLNAQTLAFSSLYSINARAGVPGVAIGRYPEDIYDGDGFKGGNPWVLTTAAFATAHYELAQAALASGDAAQAKTEFAEGDQFMERLHYHASADGNLSEQLDRNSGFMTSARDLTWSHAEFLRAAWAREAIAGKIP